MSIDNWQFISLDEFIVLQLQCAHCNVRILLGREAWDKIPQKCPSCERQWWVAETHMTQSVENALRHLQQSIKILEKAQAKRNDYKDSAEDYLGCNVSLAVRPLS